MKQFNRIYGIIIKKKTRNKLRGKSGKLQSLQSGKLQSLKVANCRV